MHLMFKFADEIRRIKIDKHEVAKSPAEVEE